MSILNEAINFAVKYHDGAFRKGTNIPYIVHPLEAGVIALSITNDLEVVSASILHDVLEDTSATKEEIKEKFGVRVLNLILADTEDKMLSISADKSWKIRKQATLDFLETADFNEQIVCLSDKLSNIRAIYRDYVSLGDKLWDRFNQKDKNEHAWYYLGIAEKLTLLKDTVAYKEYVELLQKVFDK